jgi:hypothetical protein
MANLFKKAKESAPAKSAAKKDDKLRISVSNPEFFDVVEKIEFLQTRMKEDKSEADNLCDFVKDNIGADEWAAHYQKTGKNPGSIILESKNDEGDVAQVMYVPSDKYITITEERANNLRKDYDDDIVTETTEFSFDASMVDKYGEILSDLINKSKQIAEADKEKIIKAVTKYSVAKGTIDNLAKYGDVSEVMRDVKPVISLKNVEVIKG